MIPRMSQRMPDPLHRRRRVAAALSVPLAALAWVTLTPRPAHAAERVFVVEEGWRQPAEYPIEVEPHFTFGAENVYGNTGYGGGLRLSLPVVAGYLGRVPDNLAISFGGDVVHYENCYFPDRCGANYLMLPVAAQWNIFVARRVSIFGEAGAFLYKGFFDVCAPGDGPGCVAPSDFGVLPTLAVGGRIHIGRNASFLARVGYPTITLGFSFL